MMETNRYDVVVLGAGPGGYSAAFRAADLGLKVALVEPHATLGGVCLNVGCIPSKALLHLAQQITATLSLKDHGIDFGTPIIDWAQIQNWKNSVVTSLTNGLGRMARQRAVTVIQGRGEFNYPHSLRVVNAEHSEQHVFFEHAIIAVGSRPVVLPFMPVDSRIVNSTGALSLSQIPKKMLVIGGGIIGLEMATVYSALGVEVWIVEMGAQLMRGADADLVRSWQKFNQQRFTKILLSTQVTAVTTDEKAVWVHFKGEGVPVTPEPFDTVLVAVGRVPNGGLVGADKVGVMVNELGFVAVDNQQRTNIPHIFAIGDVVGDPMLAHKAVHEGHIAAEVIAGHKRYADHHQIPSVAYTDPEVAWAGLTEEQAQQQGIQIGKAVFPWLASGRALANARSEGFTKLIFDKETNRLLGGAIVGQHAGDLIGEICLGIEMGVEPMDLARTIHPHPTLIESIGMAAEWFEGVCTDLPPKKG